MAEADLPFSRPRPMPEYCILLERPNIKKKSRYHFDSWIGGGINYGDVRNGNRRGRAAGDRGR